MGNFEYHLSKPWNQRDWVGLLMILSISIMLRIILFTGFFGSDEVIYTDQAVAIANGNWPISTYLGALRYGMNIPSAFFIRLFGPNEFSANLWAFLCSIGEVALVFLIAHLLWGLRAAVLASLVLGLLPFHVNHAGRLLPDAPLAFFVTLSLLLFFVGERRQQWLWYFSAGLAAGFAFWIKEKVILYWPVFAIYALVFRVWSWRWLWSVIGIALMIVANSVLLWMITDDPLYIFRVTKGAVNTLAHFEDVVKSPWYYFHYLFIDIRHVWIMPYLAVAGIAVWVYKAINTGKVDKGTLYVIVWGLGLICLFSFAPMSFNPLSLTPKQTNYMLIFAAPLALLAGYFLATLRGIKLTVTLVLLVAGSMALAALEQQAIHVFTANSKATVAFAERHEGIPVYGMTNAYRAALFKILIQDSHGKKPVIRPLEELRLRGVGEVSSESVTGAQWKAYAVVDLETIQWGEKEPIRHLSDVPKCWRKIDMLEPLGLEGFGEKVANLLNAGIKLLPDTLGRRFSNLTESLLQPKPAYVYGIPPDCTFSL